MYEKLVRDNIPDLLKCSGEKVQYRQAASDEEYEHFLRSKLMEEAGEFATSGDIEEIVDVLEVLDALLELKGINAEDLVQLKRRKAAKRGRFGKRLILEMEGEL